ncbi:hypothetical protein [Tamlana flava]|uniref:hypothetical protein n=1 Tax=Tamlana flava TaxID=3158572 RepID=UPI00351BE6A4
MRLPFSSLLLIVFLFTFSCKDGKKMQQFNADELLEKEQDSVESLLSLSRILIEKGDYSKAKRNLTIIINNFGTYQEVVEANNLLKNLNLQILVRQINNTKSIDSIKIWIKNVSDPDVRILADDKIEDILASSKDINELEDYLNSEGYKSHADLARNRINELKELNKDKSYANALTINDSKTWKRFIEDYPNHPERDKIMETIIMLEVDEIFSGEHGQIPPSQLIGNENNSQSSIEIENDTRYTLTIRYSGVEVRKIDITPGSTKTVKLKSGEYKVTASVNAAGVRNFAGSESLYGEYSSAYYIGSN